MARLTRSNACEILRRTGVPIDADFHQLHSTQVNAIVDEARRAGYRKPKNANGSRGRYFFAHLQRRCR